MVHQPLTSDLSRDRTKTQLFRKYSIFRGCMYIRQIASPTPVTANCNYSAYPVFTDYDRSFIAHCTLHINAWSCSRSQNFCKLNIY